MELVRPMRPVSEFGANAEVELATIVICRARLRPGARILFDRFVGQVHRIDRQRNAVGDIDADRRIERRQGRLIERRGLNLTE